MSKTKSIHSAFDRVARFGGMVILNRGFGRRILIERLMSGRVRVEAEQRRQDGYLSRRGRLA